MKRINKYLFSLSEGVSLKVVHIYKDRNYISRVIKKLKGRALYIPNEDIIRTNVNGEKKLEFI